jgi:hypothetical protein
MNSAAFPKPASVLGRVLGALLRRERLTGKDCWLRFGSSRLSHHIWRLAHEGWPIHDMRTEVTTSDAGRVASISIYWLEPADIAATGDRGRKFAQATRKIEQARKASREGQQ